MCGWNDSLQITGSWCLELPVAAVSSNQLAGNGYKSSGWKYRRYRDSVYELIKARSMNIPEATEKRRAIFTRYYTGRAREFDLDNLVAGFKPTRDCLTKLKLIVDDAPKWLEAHYRQIRSDSNTITIDLETVLWPETTTTGSR